MQKSTLVLGDTNKYLPGKLWSSYKVEISEDKMICTNKINEVCKIKDMKSYKQYAWQLFIFSILSRVFLYFFS